MGFITIFHIYLVGMLLVIFSNHLDLTVIAGMSLDVLRVIFDHFRGCLIGGWGLWAFRVPSLLGFLLPDG